MAKATDLLQQYERSRPRYQALSDALCSLVAEVLKGSGVQVHVISGRAKSSESLSDKLRRPGKEYSKLEDVTDLCGIRVITYFNDEVDRIAQRLRTEFDIDNTHSGDKRSGTSDSHFGYRSVHLVGQLKEARTTLAEYGAFDGLRFEIQIRSILQHAWAEIEHDLGYKNPRGLPSALRRRFAMLAALLELADDEFLRLRRDSKDYADHVVAQLRERPSDVPLDVVSVAELLETDPSVHWIVDELTKRGAPPVDQSSSDWMVDILEMPEVIDLETVADLAAELAKYRREIVASWEVVFPEDPYFEWTLDRIVFALAMTKIALETEPEDGELLFGALGLAVGPWFQQEIRAQVSEEIL